MVGVPIGRLALALMVLLVPTAPADVSGDWQVDGTFDAASRSRGATGRVDLICQLKQESEKLTGRCGPDIDSGVVVSGEVQDQNVVWRFEIASGPDSPKRTATFTATVDGGASQMQGTFSFAEFAGRFTAKKQ